MLAHRPSKSPRSKQWAAGSSDPPCRQSAPTPITHTVGQEILTPHDHPTPEIKFPVSFRHEICGLVADGRPGCQAWAAEELFERNDNWASNAYSYLDKSTNDLPPLAPVEQRLAGVSLSESEHK